MTFVCPPEHQLALRQVKSAVGLHHDLLDNWVYLFLVNKRYDVGETVAKLRRRDAMERETFTNLDIVPSMCRSMHSGVIQYVGRDKEGRPVLYFNTARDRPTAQERPERRLHFDIFMSWALRCDAANPTSTVTWLINQDGASLLRNIDIIFQKDMALRTSKFFPGMVARMYICNMNSTLTFVLKSLVAQLPQPIRRCIHFFSPKDVRAGRLRDFIDAAVLPAVMGGDNTDCDQPSSYDRLARTMISYHARCVDAVAAGLTVKQMEMMEAYGVDRDGRRVPTTVTPCAAARAPLRPAAGEDAACDEDEGTAIDVTWLQGGTLVTSSSRLRERGKDTVTRATSHISTSLCATLESATPFDPPASQRRRQSDGDTAETTSRISSRSNSRDGEPPMLYAHACEQAGQVSTAPTSSCELPIPRLDEIEHSTLCALLSPQPPPTPCSPLFVRRAASPRARRDVVAAAAWQPTEEERGVWLRDWVRFRCHCVDLAPLLRRLLVRWRGVRRAAGAEDEPTAIVDARTTLLHWSPQDLSHLQRAAPRLLRVAQSLLELCPPSSQRLPAAVLTWMTAQTTKLPVLLPADGMGRQSARLAADVAEATPLAQLSLDCTSPTSFLLSTQACALTVVESCARQAELDGVATRVLQETLNLCSYNATRCLSVKEAVSQVRDAAAHSWEQLVPLLQRYLECKVDLAIADFVSHHRLLIEQGKIDTNAEWYHDLFSGVVRYRELHRQRWIFHVFPPLFRGMAMRDDAPAMPELLRVARATGAMTEAEGDDASLSPLCAFITLAVQSLRATREQLAAAAEVAGSTTPARGIIENYLEHSQARLSIPYESQRSGVTPAELTRKACTMACDCLADAQPLVEKFVFLQASAFVLERVTQSDKLGAAAARVRLHTMQTAYLERTGNNQQARRIGQTLAVLAREVQDALAHETDGSSTIQGAGRPHGHALAHELLVLAALLPVESGKAPALPEEKAGGSRTLRAMQAVDAGHPIDRLLAEVDDDVMRFCAVLTHADACAESLVQAKQRLCQGT